MPQIPADNSLVEVTVKGKLLYKASDTDRSEYLVIADAGQRSTVRMYHVLDIKDVTPEPPIIYGAVYRDAECKIWHCVSTMTPFGLAQAGRQGCYAKEAMAKPYEMVWKPGDEEN